MRDMFYLVIVDDDKKKFNIVKAYSDLEINKTIVNLQEKGRNVRCFTSQMTDANLLIKARAYENQMGYKFVTEDVLT